jgi:hypothetical protein
VEKESMAFGIKNTGYNANASTVTTNGYLQNQSSNRTNGGTPRSLLPEVRRAMERIGQFIE